MLRRVKGILLTTTNGLGRVGTIMGSGSDLYTRKQIMEIVGITMSRLLWWDRKGYIPKPIRWGPMNAELLYTEEMLEKIKLRKEVVDAQSQRTKGD